MNHLRRWNIDEYSICITGTVLATRSLKKDNASGASRETRETIIYLETEREREESDLKAPSLIGTT